MSTKVVADNEDAKFVAGLIERARKAQKIAESYT